MSSFVERLLGRETCLGERANRAEVVSKLELNFEPCLALLAFPLHPSPTGLVCSLSSCCGRMPFSVSRSLDGILNLFHFLGQDRDT